MTSPAPKTGAAITAYETRGLRSMTKENGHIKLSAGDEIMNPRKKKKALLQDTTTAKSADTTSAKSAETTTAKSADTTTAKIAGTTTAKSAEYARGDKVYNRGFKAIKSYAMRHNALMFVHKGPFNWTKLHFAVWRDDLKSVKCYVEYHQTHRPEVLLQKGQWDETALQLALRLQRAPEMIRELLRGLGQAAIHIHLKEYQFPEHLENKDLWYGYCYHPIHEAVCYKEHQEALEVTKMLAKCGANLSVQDSFEDREPLEMAAQMGHLEVVKFLEKNGAKVSDEKLINEVIREKMDTKSTKLLRYLVDRNPNCLAGNEGLLFQLSEEGCFSLLQAFIKVGANANAKNAEGHSLLHVIGKKVSSDCSDNEQWVKNLEKMKKVLQAAMQKNNNN